MKTPSGPAAGEDRAQVLIRHWATVLALIIAFTCGRIALTHRIFNQVYDEPLHLAAGYDFLKSGRLTSDRQHPPLARVLFALPFLNTPQPENALPGMDRGNALLFRNDRYTQNLWRARAGNLVFVAIGIAAVALWGRHVVSPAGGLIAALLFASLPPVLAHGGLATTDMAVTAMIAASLYALTLFLERATWPRSVALGICIAAGLLVKYSFVVYFPVAAAVMMIARRRLPLTRTLAALAIAFILVWATFGFAFTTLQAADPEAVKRCSELFGAPRLATAIPLPAPEYIDAALEVKQHDIHGHKAFLFDEMRMRGWWYYFPVALFFKTPIPFLVLAVGGCAVLMARGRVEIPLIAAAILAFAMTSHINIGVRHVMPVYAPLAIAGAAAVVERRRWRIASAALVAWMLISVAASHPDYLPWFNAFAGAHPERILNDSNLDWGQDVLRLVRTTRPMKIQHLTTSLFTTAELNRIGLPPHTDLQALAPVHGRLAISEMMIAQGRAYSPEVKAWLERLLAGRPYQRIGKTIRLYDLP